MNPDVDVYLTRSKQWPNEIAALRPVLLAHGLDEQIKWAKPCYSHDGRNILILQEMKDFLAVMFFKGALLPDPDGVLESQGPNSRSALRVCIRSTADADRLSGAIGRLIDEAIEVESAGLTVAPAPQVDLVAELADRLADDAELREAFEGLTPGRRREYNLHIADAKQAATRRSRIDKLAPRILAGKGLRDR